MRSLTAALVVPTLVILLGCGRGDVGAETSSPGAFHDQHKLGMAKLREGDLEAAARAFEEAVAIHPDHPGASYSLAQVLYMMKRDEEALGHIDTAIGNDPPPPDVAYLATRKMILLALGREAEALATLERIIQLDPHDPEAHLEHCEMHLRDAEAALTRASEAAERGIASGPVRGDPYYESQIRYMCGVAWEKKGDRERAEATFRKAIEVWPRNPNPYRALGRLMLASGQVEEAEAFLKKDAELSRIQEEIDVLRNSMALEPDKVLVHLQRLLMLHIELGQLREAERCCESLVNALPGNPEALVYRGMVKRLLKQYAAAERSLLEVVEADPRFVGAYDELALLYATADDESYRSFARAWEMVRRAKTYGGVNPLTEAQVYHEEGKRDRALTTLRRALARGEGDPTLIRRRIREVEAEIEYPVPD